jgi:NAD(P)-dependent dehydrogenase (short-subunit alcohol dehydrogenase family)
VLADINRTALLEVQSELENIRPGIQVLTVVCDVTDEGSVKDMVREAAAAFGRIDYAVNSAGISNKSRVGEYETDAVSDILGRVYHISADEKWDKVINVNQRGVFFCMREQLAQMIKQNPFPL